jgi:hypothetical protein
VIGLIFHREAAEDSMGRIWRSVPASAVLFGVGAIDAAWHGLHDMMQIGLLGATVAIGVAYGFCEWPPHWLRRS